MHIAICDDHIAERKQTERLLSRESDRRKAETGVLYVHSYGHEDALLKAPKQYNMFMIDMVNSEINGLGLALILCQSGITAPIFLCVSTIDYRKAYTQLPKPPGNIHFIDKPLKVAELTKIINQAIEMQADTVPMIEIRTEAETLYLFESEIICARCNTYHTEVYLCDGRIIRAGKDLLNLYSQVCVYPAFYLISRKALVNLNYIDKCSFFNLTMKNGQLFRILPFMIFFINQSLRQLNE